MVRTQEDTSIPLKKSTRERLGTFGNKNESWDRLLNRLMDKIEDIGSYEEQKKNFDEREENYKQTIALLQDEINCMVNNAEELE